MDIAMQRCCHQSICSKCCTRPVVAT